MSTDNITTINSTNRTASIEVPYANTTELYAIIELIESMFESLEVRRMELEESKT